MMNVENHRLYALLGAASFQKKSQRSLLTSIFFTRMVFALSILTFFMQGCDSAPPDFQARAMRLSNGMQLVVIPDRRWPVITHMVWHRAGSGDEQKGKTGLAHFLEHVMFKDSAHQKKGGFSKLVSQHGGRDNAFTSYDYTAYFQRIHRDKLELMMQLESSRMRGIKISDKAAASERNVVIEELHSRLSTRPQARLLQKMRLALYGRDHPYGREIIGYEKDIKTLTAGDALDFHRRHYNPAHAVLVLAGDIGFDDAKRLAEKYYGRLAAQPGKANGDFPPVIKRFSDEARIIHRDADIRQAVFFAFMPAPTAMCSARGSRRALRF